MSLPESDKSGMSLSRLTTIESHRRISIPAMRHIWGTLLSKLSGKAHLILTRFSVRRWNTSQDSDSCVDSDVSTTWEGWNSQSSYTPASSVESIPKWDPLDNPPPLVEPVKLPIVSFSTPLPPRESLNGNWLNIDVERHEFLLSFLHQERYMDVPFGIAHRLINYIMHLTEEAAFDFVKLHIPNSMEIKLEGLETRWVEGADDVEIHYWAGHIIKHSCELEKHMAGNGLSNDLNHLRLHAVHSWEYDTYQIKAAVAFMAMLRDEKRITALEQVLRVVYLTQQEWCQPLITDAEQHLADLALGYIPTEPRTIHQVLHRAQELLESACYNYWTKHSPQRLADFPRACDTRASTYVSLNTEYGWDCPERVELDFWDQGGTFAWVFPAFPYKHDYSDPDAYNVEYLRELLNSAACLRHAAAHRRTQIGYRTLEEMLLNAQWLAEILEDGASAEEIRDKLLCHRCWDHIRKGQREDTKKRAAERVEWAEKERFNWQDRIMAHILEDSLLLREGLFACEAPLGECATQ